MKSNTNNPGRLSPGKSATIVAATSFVVGLIGLAIAGPCQAQLLQKIEQGLLGGQQQGQMGQMGQMGLGQAGGMAGQGNFVGNVNLPQGQYLMTNLQTQQAFYVTVQNGGMYLSSAPAAPNMMAQPGMMQPGMQQQPGLGGLGGLGNFIKNELAPQQQQVLPNQ